MPPFTGPLDHLQSELSLLDAALAVQASGDSRAAAQLRDMRAERDAVRAGIRLPLLELRAAFNLDQFEYQTLILAASVDIDPRFRRYWNGRPTVDTAVRLPGPDPAAALERMRHFLPGAKLFENLLLGFADDVREADPPLGARRLRVEDRVLGHMLGQDDLDIRVARFVRLEDEPPAEAATRPEILGAAQRIGGPGSCLLFTGCDSQAQHAAAQSIAAAAGRGLLTADLAAAGNSGVAACDFAALLLRECRLLRAVLFVRRGAPSWLEQILPQLGELETSLIVEAPPQWRPDGYRAIAFSFDMPDEERRAGLWTIALGSNGHRPDASVNLDSLAAKFALDSGGIAAAVHHAAALSDARADICGAGLLTNSELHEGARAASPRMRSAFARRIESAAQWDDLVLAHRTMLQLREIASAVEHRLLVYSRWGFGPKLGLGCGYKAMLSGPSGTGKTMAAGVLARGWGLDLYAVDLAAVVSKYIGETEKNLDRLFDEARLANAVLFFDEADALFGKRSEVKDAHDRYANVETAFLLQKIDAHEGVVFLASNFSRNLDTAFARRLHATVEFPLPDALLRERIWRQVFPRATPVGSDVDLGFCARNFEFSGGNIRNVALAAAFLAAEQNQPIAMRHLIVATAREMQKLGALPSRSAFGTYYDLIHGV